jgi:hypothetical protein
MAAIAGFPGWSADGEQILFSRSRFGFKDEARRAGIPRPYGEEEGAPAWQPAVR